MRSCRVHIQLRMPDKPTQERQNGGIVSSFQLAHPGIQLPIGSVIEFCHAPGEIGRQQLPPRCLPVMTPPAFPRCGIPWQRLESKVPKRRESSIRHRLLMRVFAISPHAIGGAIAQFRYQNRDEAKVMASLCKADCLLARFQVLASERRKNGLEVCRITQTEQPLRRENEELVSKLIPRRR